MAILTPGLVYISRILAFLGLFSYAAATSRRLLEQHASIVAPTWLFVTVSAVILPGLITCRVLYKDWKLRREAARLGARIAPKWRGSWVGNLDHLRLMMQNFWTGYPGDGLWEAAEELGPVFNINILWEDTVFTTCPEHIQIILATDFNNYVKGENFQKNMSAMLGVGVFNADGDMWKFHRSMTRPFFTRDRITHFDMFDRHAETFISLMKGRFRSGYAVDFQDLIGRFTLDSATEFLFGSCVHSLAAGLPYPYNIVPPFSSDTSMTTANFSNTFLEAFLKAQDAIASRERFAMVWPFLEIWQDKTEEPMKVLNAFIQPIINEAVAKRNNMKKSGLVGVEKKAEEVEEDETMLDHLVKLTDDPVVLKDATLNIMIAGRDTTAATLTFVIYFLSMYPDVMDRLRKEVLDKVGAGKRPTYDDIREMKYLRAVINETMRLYPVVPFNIRQSVHAATWPSPDPSLPPIYVPAGAKVPYSVLMMHRRKDLWGPDAEVFDPDRFLDHRLKTYLTPKPFIFLPFNAGPRICLGQQFAYNEMSFILIRLLQNFSSFTHYPELRAPEFSIPEEWKAARGRKGMDSFFPKMTITMYSGGGLWIKAREAETETL
ncbi:cytochrome P450 [Gymnopus androsaceus JB14]|uniref:Cytochrome P450 n=1 Tax=Gymnopus androsaceus JB14 TaxID=1447944 RepID=A0A6A4IDY8_9AGAR|nr:cytochrome P450 [Gymnopus androsaceus JB14]